MFVDKKHHLFYYLLIFSASEMKYMYKFFICFFRADMIFRPDAFHQKNDFIMHHISDISFLIVHISDGSGKFYRRIDRDMNTFYCPLATSDVEYYKK